MKVLYIVSWDEAEGKTTLCVGIGRQLQKIGKKVGYLKPLVLAWNGAPPIDADAQFVKDALRLEEEAETLAPLKARPIKAELPSIASVYSQVVKQAPTPEKPAEIALRLKATTQTLTDEGFLSRLEPAYTRVASGKDVMLLEGCGSLEGNDELTRASAQIAEKLEAEVILLLRYRPDLDWARIAPTAEKFGSRLLGVVVNRVPAAKLASAYSQLAHLFDQAKVKLLGALPEDRALLTVSVADLADHLHATVVCCPDALDELAENLMVGAFCVDPGKDYFARKENKVVISRGERPDMHLAALATSTRGLILTGNKTTIPQVLFAAEEKGVPILSTAKDTLSTIAGVEEALAQARFRQLKKIPRLEQSLAAHLHFEELLQGLS